MDDKKYRFALYICWTISVFSVIAITESFIYFIEKNLYFILPFVLSTGYLFWYYAQIKEEEKIPPVGKTYLEKHKWLTKYKNIDRIGYASLLADEVNRNKFFSNDSIPYLIKHNEPEVIKTFFMEIEPTLLLNVTNLYISDINNHEVINSIPFFKLKHLKELTISNTPLDCNDMENIARSPVLEIIKVWDSTLCPRELHCFLSNLKSRLKKVEIHSNAIGDEGIRFLTEASQENITHLSLAHNFISGHGLQLILNSSLKDNIEVLTLYDGALVEIDYKMLLHTKLPRLKELNINSDRIGTDFWLEIRDERALISLEELCWGSPIPNLASAKKIINIFPSLNKIVGTKEGAPQEVREFFIEKLGEEESRFY